MATKVSINDLSNANMIGNKRVERENYKLDTLKRGVWVYLILLIFEGALRKWVLPGLSDAILIIRDPVAIFILYYAISNDIKFSNTYIYSILIITFFCFVFALVFGHKNLIVAIYGCRLTLLHFPVAFLVAKIFTRDDILRVGKFIMYLSIPMTILVALQFYSPQSAWVNRGVGGNTEGAGFTGSGDFFRPPGTFSFTSGNVAFFSFAIPFILYFTFFSREIKRIFVISAIVALILAIPLSISRSLFFATLISLVFVILGLSNNVKQLGRILGGIVSIFLVLYFLSTTSIFKTSLGAFIDRFTSANENEGGVKGVIVDRFLGGMIGAIQSTGEQGNSLFGAGIGFGSNVAAKLVTGSAEVFLVAEQEWARIIGEVGTILGLLIILIRTNLAFVVLKSAWEKMKANDILPWLLCSYSFLTILQGGWAQPANLGFWVVSSGLTIASLKTDVLVNKV